MVLILLLLLIVFLIVFVLFFLLGLPLVLHSMLTKLSIHPELMSFVLLFVIFVRLRLLLWRELLIPAKTKWFSFTFFLWLIIESWMKYIRKDYNDFPKILLKFIKIVGYVHKNKRIFWGKLMLTLFFFL